MSFRRSIDGIDETDDQNGDVEGHALKSGRVSDEPEHDHLEVDDSTDEDVEGHRRAF